jgi:hypothetical protein
MVRMETEGVAASAAPVEMTAHTTVTAPESSNILRIRQPP